MIPNPPDQLLSDLLGPTQLETHPTHILVETGEFLQALLNPSTVASFLEALKTNPQTPADLATEVWCSPATISDELHTVTTLSLPLLRKPAPDEPYINTQTGLQVAGLLNVVSRTLGGRFTELDCTDQDTKSTIATVLTPLSTLESDLSWFVVNALQELSDTQDFDSTPRPVAVSDIVAETKQHQHQRGEAFETDQVDQLLTHFENTDMLIINGDECSLTEKGNLHVVQFHEVARMIEIRHQIILMLLTWRGDKLNGVTLCDLLDIQPASFIPHVSDLETMGLIEQLGPNTDALGSPTELPEYRVNMDNPVISQLDEIIGQVV